jgi:hypothetical protein
VSDYSWLSGREGEYALWVASELAEEVELAREQGRRGKPGEKARDGWPSSSSQRLGPPSTPPHVGGAALSYREPGLASWKLVNSARVDCLGA